MTGLSEEYKIDHCAPVLFLLAGEGTSPDANEAHNVDDLTVEL
jgi:hypothetical protein